MKICSIFLVLLFWSNLVSAQVKVIRSTGAVSDTPSVRSIPQSQITAEKEKTLRLSGKLTSGYQITKDTLGRETTSFSSLSSISFLTLFGLKGDISFGRQYLTNGHVKDVGLGVSLQREKFSISSNIKNSQRENILADNKIHQNNNPNINLAVNLKLIENLPMNISYSRAKNLSEAGATQTQKTLSENLSYGMQSSFGKLSWNCSLASGITQDLLLQKKTRNQNLNLSFGSPLITDKLSMNFSMSPARTKNYLPDGADTQILQQNYSTGLNFKASEQINTSLSLSLNKNRAKNSVSQNSSSARGYNFNLAYRITQNLNTSYNLSQTRSGNFYTTNNYISTLILPMNKKISNINISYQHSTSKSQTTKKSQNFNLTSGLNPHPQTNITFAYGLDLPDGGIKNHQINTALSQAFGKLSTGLSFSDNRRYEHARLINKLQNYQLTTSYSLNILKRNIPLSNSYIRTLSGGDKPSKSQNFNLSFSLPIRNNLSFGYAYSLSRTQDKENSSNNFNLGFSLRRKEWTLNTNYQLLLTDSQSTQEATIGLNLPIAKDLSLSNSVHYIERAKERPAYSFNSGLVYSF